MQFSMQIKHFFCIYPCILVVFFIVRPLPEYPALPDERAARSVISGYFRLFPTNPPLSTARSILLFFSIPPSEV